MPLFPPDVIYLGTDGRPRRRHIVAFSTNADALEWALGSPSRYLWPVQDISLGDPKVSTIVTERRLVPIDQLDEEQQRVHLENLPRETSDADGTPGPASRRRLVRRLEDTAGPDDIDNTVFDPDEREAAKVHLANADEVTGVRRVI